MDDQNKQPVGTGIGVPPVTSDMPGSAPAVPAGGTPTPAVPAAPAPMGSDTPVAPLPAGGEPVIGDMGTTPAPEIKKPEE